MARPKPAKGVSPSRKWPSRRRFAWFIALTGLLGFGGYFALQPLLVEARKAQNATPILILTAKAEIDDKIKGLDAGANDYLTKPFDMRELLARLRVLTRKSERQQTNLLSFGNTTLNTETFELSAPGGSYKLANKEYQTMLLFMRNPGAVISSSKILENIWDPESKAEDNTVWTYISYLRRKLEAIRANVGIRTMRGAGYALEVQS